MTERLGNSFKVIQLSAGVWDLPKTTRGRKQIQHGFWSQTVFVVQILALLFKQLWDLKQMT